MILRALLEAVDAGRRVALLTVVETARSVPRHARSKMLVFDDRTSVGSIGGGEMEQRAIDEAMQSLEDGMARLRSYDLVDPARGDPGICGGSVQIYIEPHLPRPTLYVVGCGHVGRAVAHLASWLDYRVVATDDRPGLAEAVERADRRVDGPIAEALDAEPVTADTSIVVVTRNAALDLEILPVLLDTPARYIGVMGSERRWRLTREQLAERGIDPSALDRVHNPVGLEIGAETPEEIAISIMAEVVSARRG